MARKRARTNDGHFIADDPTTEKNEAYEEAVKPARKARQNNAPKNDKKSEYSFFVSANPEASAFNIRVGDVGVDGRWDVERQYVHWRVPKALTEGFKMHHHVWSGRIISCEDE